MRTVTLDPMTWQRGSFKSMFRRAGYSLSSLLTNRNTRCCLGFDAQVCGFRDEEIREVTYPYKLVFEELSYYGGLRNEYLSAWTNEYLDKNSTDARLLGEINDRIEWSMPDEFGRRTLILSDRERFNLLAPIFARNGVVLRMKKRSVW